MFNSTDYAPRQDISAVLMEGLAQRNEFIAQKIFPVYPSGTKIGRYPKFRLATGELLDGTNTDTRRGPTGGYMSGESSFEWDNYQTMEYGWEERVSDEERIEMENFFDTEVLAGQEAMNRVMIDYEKQVKAATFDTNMFQVSNASVAYTEANLATMNVPLDFNNAFEQQSLVGETPETMIISLHLWNRIRRSNSLMMYVFGVLNVSQGSAWVTPEMFAKVFGLKELIIAKKSVNMGLKKATLNVQPIWTNDFIALARLGEGDFINGGAGRTIVWDADSPGGLFTTEEYRVESRRSNMIRVRSNRVQKVINPLALRLIRTNSND